MLRVMIELVPGGHEADARVIEQLVIANVSESTDAADYDFAMTNREGVYYGSVYRHQRRDGAWTLVDRVLTSLFSLSPMTETQRALGERLAR